MFRPAGPGRPLLRIRSGSGQPRAHLDFKIVAAGIGAGGDLQQTARFRFCPVLSPSVKRNFSLSGLKVTTTAAGATFTRFTRAIQLPEIVATSERTNFTAGNIQWAHSGYRLQPARSHKPAWYRVKDSKFTEGARCSPRRRHAVPSLVEYDPDSLSAGRRQLNPPVPSLVSCAVVSRILTTGAASSPVTPVAVVFYYYSHVDR